MGKNHRHKKQLKSERAKIKLKNHKTQFLPKGKNVTDASFKIKPIVMPEQLRVRENEALSSRKLSLKEILNRLTHHNAKVKYDNCHQLFEFIHRQDELFFKQNACEIYPRVCPLMLDIEHKVRREAVRVLSYMLQQMTVGVTSFFNILSSYLRCSMTHINVSVQEDSLLFLDALVEYVPDLVAEHYYKILETFLTLISRLKRDGMHGRTLKDNLQSKHTGINWRMRVLIRLKRIFEAIYRQKLPEKEIECEIGRIVDTTTTSYAPLYGYDKFTETHCRDRLRKHIDVGHMEAYINILLPLFLESWVEAAPSMTAISTLGKTNSIIIKDQTATILNCILTVFYVLFRLDISGNADKEITAIQKFRKEPLRKLLNAILGTFPYAGLHEKKHETFGANNDPRCVEENLLICYLFSVQYRNITGKYTAYAEKIVGYLGRAQPRVIGLHPERIENRATTYHLGISTRHCTYYVDCCELFSRNKEYMQKDKLRELFVSTLTTILGKNLTCWRQAKIQMDAFIENLTGHYLRNVVHETDTDLLERLHEVLDATSEMQVRLSEKSCQHLLQPEISHRMSGFLLLMVKRNVKPVQDCIRRQTKEILGNINKIRIKGLEIERMKVIRILCLWLYVPLDDSNREALIQFSLDNPVYSGVINDIVEKWAH